KSLKPNRLIAPVLVCRGRSGRVALVRIRIRAVSRSDWLRSRLRPELPARCEIARPAWNIIDEIVCLAERFAEMAFRAGANVRQDVGAGFPWVLWWRLIAAKAPRALRSRSSSSKFCRTQRFKEA